MDNTTDFQTVSHNKKKSSRKGVSVPMKSEPVKSIPVTSSIIDTYNNRRKNFANDRERLAYCTQNNKPFKIFTEAKHKDTIRNVLGNEANRELNITQTTGRQKKSNNAIFEDIKTKARRYPDSAITYMLFCAHAVLKNHNIELLTLITNYLISNYGLTMEQVLDSRYGDYEFSLLNTAAWNLDKSGIVFCVSNGADIDFINMSGENIQQVMEAGYHKLRKYKKDEMSKRAFATYYNECCEYIKDTRALRKQEAERKEIPQEQVFTFVPKKKEVKKEVKKQAPVNAFSAFEDDDSDEEETTIVHVFDDAGKKYVSSIMERACEIYMDDGDVNAFIDSKTSDMSPELVEFLREEFDKTGF